MRKRGLFRALCVGCAILAASPCWAAATVEPGSGKLTINRGHGFKPVTGPVNAKVGDSVMVGPGGSAMVVYDDGCKVNVQPGAVLTIEPLSPCASGSNAAQGSWFCDALQVCTFLVAYAVAVGLIGYQISQINGQITITAKPASP
jgi:hypothetical protein